MGPSSRNRPLPAGNPLANVLVIIAGALAIGLSVVLGVVAFLAFAAVFLVLAAVIGVRLWWLNRTRPAGRPHGRRREQSGDTAGDVIEGEFQIIQDDERRERPPQ